MGRQPAELHLIEEELTLIKGLIRSPQTSQGQVTRLRVVEMAHAGCTHRHIAETLNIALSTV